MLRRKRGVILTSVGLQKFEEARHKFEFRDNFGKRFTLEELSYRTNLDPLTIRKVLNRRKGVDKRTLEALFLGFDSRLCEGYYSTSDPNCRQDWGEAVSVLAFYGRTEELSTLDEWLLKDSCRLVTILGMGGVGKTSLSIKLAELMQDKFDCIVWRSLYDAPPIDTFLGSIIQFLSDEQETEAELPESVSDKISLLLNYFKEMRCLVVFDNVDAVLRGGSRAGQYNLGYEQYGELIKRVGKSDHQSCLLLTTREKPKEVASLEGEALPVRTLRLGGLKEGEGEEILKSKRLKGLETQFNALVKRYGGNALALKIVATTIQDLFDGYISEFLKEETTVFGDLRDLLEQQFERLSDEGKDVMYWLAINREPVTLSKLREDLVSPFPQLNLIETLESLGRRSLIERDTAYFTLQPVVMEYVTSRLIEQICEEIVKQEFSLFRSHALIKATAKDYIRETQIRLILYAAINRLIPLLQGKKNLEYELTQILLKQREKSPLEPGYVAGNILNLLNQLGTNLTGYDFSGLSIWQADLRDVNLQNTNFAYTHLVRCTFTETFGAIHAVAFSPDGELLAVGDSNGEIHLYQVSDVQPVFICTRHKSWVTSLTFSPDGKILASGSTDYTIKLWDVSTGQCLRTLEGHTNEVWSVAFSQDNCTLASGSDDCTVKLWNSSTGECFKTLQGHLSWVLSVVFRGDTQLLSGSDDRTVKLWDINTGQCMQTFEKHHSSGIRSITLSPDGQILASGSEDRTIRLWKTQTGECLKTLLGHSNRVFSVDFSPQGDLLASGGHDHTVKLWGVDTGECFKTLQGHFSWVFAVAFSPQGKLLASGGHDQTVKLWSVDTGECVKTLQGYTNQILSVTFSPVGASLPSIGQIFASSSRDRTVRLWDAATGECLKVLKGHSNSVHSVIFNHEGNILVSSSVDKTLKIWDVPSGKTLRTLQGHRAAVLSIALSPDSQTIASGSEDCTIKLWDVRSGRTLRTLQGHDAAVWSVAFISEAEILASGSWDQTIKLWDIHTGNCLRTLAGHTSWIWAIAIAPDGNTLASASPDRTIRLWNPHTGDCLNVLQADTNWLQSIAFSPDGNILASTSHDLTIKLWDVCTGKCLKVLHGHTGLVWSVAFSPDNQTLVSGGDDETIKLWDIGAGKCLKTMRASKPYEQMNIFGVKGLTEAATATLTSLGAVI
ncbi:NB-ARC domain-containing protein [Nostoc sp.]|uniref:WD40 domain-containing protein n=1 Tax=Nostoc sp. TaxID=1180 RepID=UPI002FF69513